MDRDLIVGEKGGHLIHILNIGVLRGRAWLPVIISLVGCFGLCLVVIYISFKGSDACVVYVS